MTEPAQRLDLIREQVALYVFGLLQGPELEEMEACLAAGDPDYQKELRAFEEAASALPLSLEGIRPSPQLRQRLLDRIEHEPAPPPSTSRTRAEEALPGVFVVRQAAGDWRPTDYTGVSFRTLYFDPATRMATSLLKMEPGSAYPAHRHTAVEQCLILEGAMYFGDLELRAGDFEWAVPGTSHEVIRSEQGALALIIASTLDEVIA